MPSFCKWGQGIRYIMPKPLALLMLVFTLIIIDGKNIFLP